MKRRNFLRVSLFGTSAALLAAGPVLAGHKTDKAAMAGGVFYTQDAPGRWSKKAGGHVPLIKVDGNSVQVTTPHEMRGYDHYINKHILLDKDYHFIAERLFDPKKDKAPISTFSLGSYSGTIYALSVCNLHDTWLSQATV